MRNFIKIKRAEWKLKAMLYSTIAAFMDNRKDILSMLQKLFIALKDVPADELHEELIHSLAEIIHEENRHA